MKYKAYWPLLIILIIAAILRLYNLTAIALWHDEAFSALLIKYPWREMFYRIGLDVHPPAYYVLLRLWANLFGGSLLALRGFSVFFSLAGVVAGYSLVKYVFKNEQAALWAALLLAVNPFQVQYVTEARMYTMGAFFALLAAYLLVRALREQNEFRQYAEHSPRPPGYRKLRRAFIRDYFLFALATIIIIYTHYYLLFTAIAIGLYGLIYLIAKYKNDFKQYLGFVSSMILVALAFLPWLKIFLFQFHQVGADYWIPPMDRWSIPETFWQMLIGTSMDINQTATKIKLVAITLIALYAIYRLIRTIAQKEKWLLVLNVAAPFAGAILFFLLARLHGQNSSVYLDRYFLFSSMFLTLAVALWLNQMRLRWFGQALLVILILVNLWAFARYWRQLNVGQKPGMAAAARLLQHNLTPQNKLFVGSSFEFFNLKYYITQDQIPARPLLYTDHHYRIADLPHYAGTALLNNDDLLPDFNAGVRNGDTIWLIWTNGFGGSKPVLPQNWTQEIEYTYPEVRPYVGTNIYVDELRVN